MSNFPGNSVRDIFGVVILANLGHHCLRPKVRKVLVCLRYFYRKFAAFSPIEFEKECFFFGKMPQSPCLAKSNSFNTSCVTYKYFVVCSSNVTPLFSIFIYINSHLKYSGPFPSEKMLKFRWVCKNPLFVTSIST